MASTNLLMINLDKKTRLIEQSLSPIKFKERSLRKCLQLLKMAAKEISLYANEYNYQNMDANGFWSFVRLIDKFCDVTIESLSMNNYRDYDPIIDNVASLLVSYLPIVETIREATSLSSASDANRNISYKNRNSSDDTSLSSSRSSTPTGVQLKAGVYNMRTMASTLSSAPASPTQLITDADTMIIAFRQFLELEPDQRSLHMLGSFWLAPSMKKSQSMVTLLMALFSKLPLSFLSLFDRSYRGNLITLCQNRATRDYPFAIWNLSELEVSKFVTKYLLYRDSKLENLNISNIQVSRQSLYMVPPDGGRVKLMTLNVDKSLERSNSWLSISYAERLAKHFDAKSKIKCLLIKPSSFGVSKDDVNSSAIILHAHGGGLIAQTPDSHLSYLTDWCNKLQTPILSVDYKTGQGLFTALQDILDCYLWLASGSLDVELTLGYVPSKIILVGDSAGGSLHLTLSFVLADINKLMMYQEEDPELIKTPDAMVLIYTGFRTPGTSASRMLMSMIDPVLSTGVILACAEQTDEEFGNESFGAGNVSTPGKVSSYLSSFIPNVVSNTFNVLTKDVSILAKAMKGLRGVPWYRKSNFHIKKRIFELQSMFERSPYLILSGKKMISSVHSLSDQLASGDNNNEQTIVNADFSSVQNVPLHLITTHFDPMLDDNVSLSNLWQGLVNLCVLDDLPHGFLNFTSVSKEAQNGSDFCVNTIKKLIK